MFLFSINGENVMPQTAEPERRQNAAPGLGCFVETK
jgi:hypothetical protein